VNVHVSRCVRHEGRHTSNAKVGKDIKCGLDKHVAHGLSSDGNIHFAAAVALSGSPCLSERLGLSSGSSCDGALSKAAGRRCTDRLTVCINLCDNLGPCFRNSCGSCICFCCSFPLGAQKDRCASTCTS
jgi:hypothetical protein